MSIGMQAYAFDGCCKNNKKGSMITKSGSSEMKMPCHDMAKNDAGKSDIEKNKSGKTHQNCCCDMGNCVAKIFFKTPITNSMKLEQISFATFSETFASFNSDSSEQPPKQLA